MGRNAWNKNDRFLMEGWSEGSCHQGQDIGHIGQLKISSLSL
jgi:hypothetical protein